MRCKAQDNLANRLRPRVPCPRSVKSLRRKRPVPWPAADCPFRCDGPRLVDPLGEEEIRLAFLLAEAVAREHEVASIGREHREGIELRAEGDLLGTLAVFADQEE